MGGGGVIVALPVAITGSMVETVGAVALSPVGCGVVGVGGAEQAEAVPELGDVQVDLVEVELDGPARRR